MKRINDEVETQADLLGGGDEITRFLFGAVDGRLRRRMYHLTEFHELPTFKVGQTLYARKTKLLEWIEANEMRQSKK